MSYTILKLLIALQLIVSLSALYRRRHMVKTGEENMNGDYLIGNPNSNNIFKNAFILLFIKHRNKVFSVYHN